MGLLGKVVEGHCRALSQVPAVRNPSTRQTGPGADRGRVDVSTAAPGEPRLWMQHSSAIASDTLLTSRLAVGTEGDCCPPLGSEIRPVVVEVEGTE